MGLDDPLGERAKHLSYAVGWKKLEPAWDWIIRRRRLARMRPVLGAVLSPVGSPSAPDEPAGAGPSTETSLAG